MVKLQGRSGAGKRRNKGDPLANLLSLIDGLGDEPRAEGKEALCGFLERLTVAQRKRIVSGWSKLSRHHLVIHDALVTHAYELTADGPGGPAGPLLVAMKEADNAWLLPFLGKPEPIGGPQRSAEEWRRDRMPGTGLLSSLRMLGGPRSKHTRSLRNLTRLDGPTRDVRELAALLLTYGIAHEVADRAAVELQGIGRFYAESATSLARSPEEHMRDFHLEHGATPEAADAMLLDDRRNKKWAEVSNAILPETLAAKDRLKEQALRPVVEKPAELAARFTDAAAELANHAQRIALDRRQISRYYAPGPESVPWWFAFGDDLDGVAERADKLAGELRKFAAELAQPAGSRQKTPLVWPPRSCMRNELSYAQTAKVLGMHDVVPDGYTPDNVRDLLRKTPGSNPDDTK